MLLASALGPWGRQHAAVWEEFTAFLQEGRLHQVNDIDTDPAPVTAPDHARKSYVDHAAVVRGELLHRRAVRPPVHGDVGRARPSDDVEDRDEFLEGLALRSSNRRELATAGYAELTLKPERGLQISPGLRLELVAGEVLGLERELELGPAQARAHTARKIDARGDAVT